MNTNLRAESDNLQISPRTSLPFFPETPRQSSMHGQLGYPQKLPPYLLKTKVNLFLPKFDTDFPDYKSSPIAITEEQLTLVDLREATLRVLNDASTQSALSKTLNPKEPSSTRDSHRGSGFQVPIEDIHEKLAEDVFKQKEVIKRKKRYERLEKFLDNIWINLLFFFITVDRKSVV